MLELKSREEIVAGMFSKPVVTTEKQDYIPTAGQVKYYTDLCAQKGVKVDSDVLVSGLRISAEIQNLLTMKSVTGLKAPSDKQIARIKEYCGILGMVEPDYTKLDGSFNGSASQLIQKLGELAKDKPVPLSEKQYETLLKYSLCPDVYGYTAEDASKFTKQEASEFIGKFQDAYSVWIKNRLSEEQFNKISKLMGLMDSEIAYESVIQLDTESADEYIKQLQYEYSQYCKKDWRETTLEPEEMRGISTKEDEDDTDGLMEIRGLVAKLYACLGQEIDEETFETLDIDKLKDLIQLVQLYGSNVEEMLDEVKALPLEQKQYLLN